MHTDTKSTKSDSGAWFLTALMTGAVLFAAIELLFRAVLFPEWKAVTWATFERHPIYGTFQKPNLSVRRLNPPNYDVVNTTNSMGFRDREVGFKEDLNGIWLAGMSNSYGGFVDDDKIFAARIQAMGYEVANLSSEGHRIPNQIKVMRHMAQSGYHPKAVIFELTLNNALGEYQNTLEEFSGPLTNPAAARSTSESVELPRDRLRKKFDGLISRATPSLVSLKGLALNNSATYAWAKVFVNASPPLRKLTLELGIRADVALVDPAPPELLMNQPETPSDNIITSTATLMTAIQNWVTTNLKVPFGVILIPSPHHLDRARFNRYLRHIGQQGNDMDATRPHRLLLKALRSAGIPTLDMAPTMKASSTPLSFPDDGHMNEEAHGLVAKRLAAWLTSQFGLMPKK